LPNEDLIQMQMHVHTQTRMYICKFCLMIFNLHLPVFHVITSTYLRTARNH